MKTYEKPVLMALSLGGNDRLCGDCYGKDTQLGSDVGLNTQFGNEYGNQDGTLTYEEASKLFGLSEEPCWQGGRTQVPYFCRYTSASYVCGPFIDIPRQRTFWS